MEIEFRGKCLQTGEWVYGNLLENEQGAFIVEEFDVENSHGTGTDLYATDFRKVDEKTVGMFSNFECAKKERLYDGDIVKRQVHIMAYGTDLNELVDDIGKIEYRAEYGGFYIGERELFAEVKATYDFYTSCGCTVFEKVGNVHDNPELLEQPNSAV